MKLDELKKQMKGVMTILSTPFNKDGSLDLEGMRANTRWLAEYATGKDFIFTPAGSGGEWYAMSDDERKAVIKMTVEEVKGQNVVIAGAGLAGTRETIKTCQDAQSLGADGAMVIIPYYHVPEEEGMYQHYKEVAESVGKDFGIMVYNNPFVSGSWVKPALMARLSKIPNIIADKECTSYIRSYYAMREAVDPKDAALLCGQDEQMYLFVALCGYSGYISTIANFVPDRAYSIYKAAAARDFNKLTELVDSLAPYFDFVGKVDANHGPHTGIPSAESYGGNMYIAVAKGAMDMVGLRGGEVRLPLVGLNGEEKAELRDVLRAMRLLK